MSLFCSDKLITQNKGFYWPTSKNIINKFDYTTLNVGQIIDVQDRHLKWYESVIRKVFRDDNNDNIRSIIVHYCGWSDKYDELIYYNDLRQRINARNIHTYGPYIRENRTWMDLMNYKYDDVFQTYK